MGGGIVNVRGLRKSFGKVLALNGVDLTLAEGRVHGFLGPNGAGKSTTIRILLGLVRPDAGDVTMWGRDAWSEAKSVRGRLAYVPGDVALWPTLTGAEVIQTLGGMRGGFEPGRVTELVERFELDPSKKCGTYSKGNRQKVMLIAALASSADLLVLDEPTVGLDPLMEAEFAKCIIEEKSKGRTVLLSSHTLAQVEKLCDDISIIRRGVVVDQGTLAELRHLSRSTIRAITRTDVTERVMRMAGVHSPQGSLAGTDELLVDVDAESIDSVIQVLSEAGIISLVSQPPSLEQLFMGYYGADGLPAERDFENGQTLP